MVRCVICKKEYKPIRDEKGYTQCPRCHSSFPIQFVEKGTSLEEMGNTKDLSDKIEIATHVLVGQYEDIANHFIPEILGIKIFCITDESSLLDLNFKIVDKKVKRNTDKDLEKIKKVYGVDVSDIEDLNLVKIFERLRILSPIFNS